jgi:hypothetical protein
MANTYSATCKTANPCAIVTFNGTDSDSVSDTQRGETAIDASTGLPAKGLPTSRWDKNGLQVMWDFPLQAAWGPEIADNSPATTPALTSRPSSLHGRRRRSSHWTCGHPW